MSGPAESLVDAISLGLGSRKDPTYVAAIENVVDFLVARSKRYRNGAGSGAPRTTALKPAQEAAQ